MSLQIEINVKKILSSILPKSLKEEDKHVKFYYLVFRQANRDVIRIPFFRQYKEITFYLFKTNQKIPPKLLTKSLFERLYNDTDDVFVHVYKFMSFGDSVLGMDRIKGKNSSSQDVSVLKINVKTKKNINSDFIRCTWLPELKSNVFEPVNSLDIYENNPESPAWKTQRNFYSLLHKSYNMELHRLNCEKTVSFLKSFSNHNFANILDFVTKWSEFMMPCDYVPDTNWFDNRQLDDKGDAAIESTKKGDCEDFAHYFTRMFYVLIEIFEYIITKNNSSYKICNILKTNYKPFVYICRVKIYGKNNEINFDYHSTMLLLPIKKLRFNPVISFEATNPNSHCIVGKKSDFYDWHIEHYFMVDKNHICRFDKSEFMNIENLSLEVKVKDFFNY